MNETGDAQAISSEISILRNFEGELAISLN